MKGPTLLLLTALAVIALLALLGWTRRRALLRAPGSFPATLVDGRGRRRVVVGCYDRSALVLTSLWLPGRVLWRVERHRLEIERAAEPPSEGRALLRVQDTAESAEPLLMEVDQADAGAVRAWAEAGPSPAAQAWWHAPGRG